MILDQDGSGNDNQQSKIGNFWTEMIVPALFELLFIKILHSSKLKLKNILKTNLNEPYMLLRNFVYKCDHCGYLKHKIESPRPKNIIYAPEGNFENSPFTFRPIRYFKLRT